jgi:hypothetical protein
MLMAQEMYVIAEDEYRRDRAAKQYDSRPRRHLVRRRPSLHLPRPRRRPVSLA